MDCGICESGCEVTWGVLEVFCLLVFVNLVFCTLFVSLDGRCLFSRAALGGSVGVLEARVLVLVGILLGVFG